MKNIAVLGEQVDRLCSKKSSKRDIPASCQDCDFKTGFLI